MELTNRQIEGIKLALETLDNVGISKNLVLNLEGLLGLDIRNGNSINSYTDTPMLADWDDRVPELKGRLVELLKTVPITENKSVKDLIKVTYSLKYKLENLCYNLKDIKEELTSEKLELINSDKYVSVWSDDKIISVTDSKPFMYLFFHNQDYIMKLVDNNINKFDKISEIAQVFSNKYDVYSEEANSNYGLLAFLKSISKKSPIENEKELFENIIQNYEFITMKNIINLFKNKYFIMENLNNLNNRLKKELNSYSEEGVSDFFYNTWDVKQINDKCNFYDNLLSLLKDERSLAVLKIYEIIS